MSFEQGFTEELEKLSQDEERAGSALPLLGAMATPAAAGIVGAPMGQSFLEGIKGSTSIDPLSPEETKRLMQEIIGGEIPHIPVEDLHPFLQAQLQENAAFIPPGKIAEILGIDPKKYPKGVIAGNPEFMKDPAIFAHELGHAGSFKGLGKHLLRARIPASLGLAATPIMSGLLAGREVKKDETSPLSRAASFGVGGGSAAAMLIPEAEASIRGIRGLRGIGRSGLGGPKKRLAHAFATYAVPSLAAGIGAPAAAFGIGSHVREKRREAKRTP